MYKIAMIVGGCISEQYKAAHPEVMIFDEVKFSMAIDVARRLTNSKEVDAIISPSGTAAVIEPHVPVPVIRSDPSRLDILEELHYAETTAQLSGRKIALVLHKSRSIDLNALRPFLNNEICHFSYENEEDIQDILGDLSKKEYPALVGGPTALHFAEEKGILGFILRLSPESLDLSIKRAYDILSFSQKSREQSDLLETALNLFAEGVLITNEVGRVIVSNSRAADILKMSREDLLGQWVDELLNDASCGEVYLKGIQQQDRIIEYADGISLFSSRMPVITENRVQGAVITFQETEKIEKLEHKYRQYRSRGLTARYHFSDIIGVSPATKLAIEKAKAFSQVNSTVLIRGETGSGKELFSQSVHNFSHRSKGPFVAINCAALPPNLLESELMGYEEGAFTRVCLQNMVNH